MIEKIKSIRSLVVEGHIKEALMQLKDLVSEDTSKTDEVLSLLARQNRLNKIDSQGTLLIADKNIEQNKINNSILQIIRSLEAEKGIKNEVAQSAASNFVNELRKSREFTFLLIGKTGVGKSSTINNLMGSDIAEVGDYIPTTMDVKEYRLPIEGFNFHVVDTPGLCDDLPEKGNDQKYIEEIKSKVKQIDTVLYVTNLNDTRVRIDEKQGIELMTKAFTEKIWENSVIVFTFSNSVPPQKFSEALKVRSGLIRQAIQDSGVSKEMVNQIPSVAVDNMNELNPDGKYWLGELYTQVAERVSHEGFAQFFMSTINRIEVVDNSSKSTQLVTTSVEPHAQINPYIDFRPTIRVTHEKERVQTSKIKVTKEQEERLVTKAKEKGFFKRAEEFVEKNIVNPVRATIKKIKDWFWG